MAGLDATRACLETIGNGAGFLASSSLAGQRRSLDLSGDHLKEKHKHDSLPLCCRAKGRQQGKSPLHEMHVKGGQEIYPDDVPASSFCADKILAVVPVEEPLTSEHVQDIKDGGAILLHLMNGGRGGRSWAGREGVQFQPLGRWSGRGGTKASPRTPWSYHGKDQEGLDRNTWDEAFA